MDAFDVFDVPAFSQGRFWLLLVSQGLPVREDKNLAAEKLTQDLLDFIRMASGISWMPPI
jgi:hypothetical protein